MPKQVDRAVKAMMNEGMSEQMAYAIAYKQQKAKSYSHKGSKKLHKRRK